MLFWDIVLGMYLVLFGVCAILAIIVAIAVMVDTLKGRWW